MDPNNDNLFQNESIFQSAKNFEDSMSANLKQQAQPQNTGLLGKFVKTITNKLNEYDEYRDNKKLQSQIGKIFEKEEKTLELLMNFGCKLEYNGPTKINIIWDKYKLKGQINLDSKCSEPFDAEAKKILGIIVNTILSSNNMENTIDRLEAEGFYPVGELENQTAILENKEVEVLIGTFENSAGETRKIYYYNGKEVFPPKE